MLSKERISICAAKHIIAAYESSVKNIPVDFGEICTTCNELRECKAHWLENLKPIFDIAGVHPNPLIKEEAVTPQPDVTATNFESSD